MSVGSAVHFRLLRTRTFDHDEFQHLHAGFALSQGKIPFRDFFEHHMPAIQMMLAPSMHLFDIPHSADDAIAFLLAARLLMACFAGAAVVLTARLSHQRAGAAIGWVTAALLSCSIVFSAAPSSPSRYSGLALMDRGSLGTTAPRSTPINGG